MCLDSSLHMDGKFLYLDLFQLCNHALELTVKHYGRFRLNQRLSFRSERLYDRNRIWWSINCCYGSISWAIFWHINHVEATDWDASYYFEGGQMAPGECAACRIILSPNLIKCSNGRFSKGEQFGIREGSRIVGVGTIVSSKVKNA